MKWKVDDFSEAAHASFFTYVANYRLPVYFPTIQNFVVNLSQ